MHAHLIVSPDRSSVSDIIHSFRTSHRVFSWNYHEIFPSPSIGIEQIRSVRHIVTRKPTGGGERLIVFFQMERATHQAQNALLKLLEEPPSDTWFFLTTSRKDAILPTVTSRCRVVFPPSASDWVPSSSLSSATHLLSDILSSSCAHRLVLSKQLATSQEDVLTLLSSFLSVLHRSIAHPSDTPFGSYSRIVGLMKKIEAAYQYISGNVQYKATLDVLFLGFPPAS